ncbi:MAG: hypothetical protein ACXWP5_05510 [Bdellovibrionota bacterium]
MASGLAHPALAMDENIPLDRAKIVRSKDSARTLPGLHFDSDEIQVKVAPDGARAILKGKYRDRRGWNFLYGTNPVPVGPESGEFQIEVPIDGTENTVDLLAVSPLGELAKERIEILFPGYALRPKSEPRILGLTPGIGFSYIVYTDSRPGLSLTEFGLTAKLSFNHSVFKPYLDIGANTYITAVPFGSSLAVQARFFGANARFGYILPKPSEPWHIGIYAGYYFTTMIVSPLILGFGSMQGPQLYPSVRYTFKSGSALSFYAKYSPVVGNGGFLNPLNAELAGGTSYAHLLPNAHPLAISLDCAYLNLLNVQNFSGVNISVLSFTASVGYGF